MYWVAIERDHLSFSSFSSFDTFVQYYTIFVISIWVLTSSTKQTFKKPNNRLYWLFDHCCNRSLIEKNQVHWTLDTKREEERNYGRWGSQIGRRVALSLKRKQGRISIVTRTTIKIICSFVLLRQGWTFGFWCPIYPIPLDELSENEAGSWLFTFTNN
jgi:hypothetical protein